MKNKIFATIASLALIATSCDFSDFGDINVNPNSPSQPNTGMLFTYACMYARNFIMTSNSYDPWPVLYTGYIAECKNNQYGGLTTTESFNTRDYYLRVMRQLNTIVSLNEDEATANEVYVTAFGSSTNQIAAATTLKAFYMMTLTDIVGPLPYSEAFKGEPDGNWTPKFDSVEDIYAQLNDELASAYSKFDESGSLSSYDIFYGGDISKWKKFNATLRMLMAIKLADVAPTVGKERFAKAYADGGMVDVGDGLNYTFSTNTNVEDGSTHTYYAWFYYVGNAGYAQRGLGFSPNKFIVDGLKEYKDPRMFTYFTTNGYLGQVVDADGNAVDPESFDSYNGVTYGLISNDAVRAEAENACSVADKYCEINAAYGLITTARCLLVEAEAAQLGWISESASTLYEAGIRASFDYNGATGVDDYIAAHPLPSDKTNALKEIVMQRWFDGFLTDEIEIWSDWRRYNVPSLPLTEYQKESCKAETYPYRLIYYDDDRNYNIDNYNECINTYFSGNDSRWQRIWWDVADNE